jgi:CubicO group peptidase (beta-lactamase class C family)/ketosteroid isomerase-like protein
MKFLSSAFALLFLSTVVFSQTKIEQLDELLDAYTSKHQFNGTALVFEKGSIILNKGYGWRDKEAEAKNNAHTVYQIGSVTKQFTALVILKLEEQGKLKLTDKLSQYFPDYPKGDIITIHHLLSHTSGIYNYTNNGDFLQNESSKPASQAKMLSLFKDQPFDFAPGTDWAYSNSGYMLLGYIIEKVAKKPYEQVVTEMIFKPLSMTHSGFDFAHLNIPNKPAGYFSVKDNNKSPIVDSTVSYAGGAIYSTTDDMLLWHLGLLNNKIVKRSTIEKAFTPYKNNFGYGWVINKFNNKKGVSHNGSILGFTSNIYRIEEDDLCIVLLCNIGTQKIDEITQQMLYILYDKPYKVPSMPKAISLSRSTENQYLGTYEFSPRFKAIIHRDNNQLYAQRQGESMKHLLTPIAENRFFVSNVEQELEFIGNEKEGYNEAKLHTGQEPMIGERIAPAFYTLSDTILALDNALFDAYNKRDLEKMLVYFSKDLEFFHDLGGLSNYETNKNAFDQNFKAGKKIRRTLVESSTEVYPIKNYGAIQVGAHTFCNETSGQNNCSTIKFVHVWEKKNERWQITRVVSFAH